MIELGGNISLEGFENIEPGALVVIKKIVGNYVKKISESINFEKLHVILKKERPYDLEVKLISDGNNKTSESKDGNLFFALDKALSKL